MGGAPEKPMRLGSRRDESRRGRCCARSTVTVSIQSPRWSRFSCFLSIFFFFFFSDWFAASSSESDGFSVTTSGISSLTSRLSLNETFPIMYGGHMDMSIFETLWR